jgi:predicted esterase
MECQARQIQPMTGKTAERQVSYSTDNTYATLNSLCDTTRNIWIVFHGIGYLSRFFLRYFDELPAKEHYLIAPQAPSKYYLGTAYRHVGASWLTRENTRTEIENVLRYLDAVYRAEDLPPDRKLVIFGFSQGVSIATRWMASRKIPCDSLILFAGSVPEELTPADFDYLNPETMILSVAGNRDEFLKGERREKENEKLKSLFPGKVKHLGFEGGHELKKELITQFI